MALLEHLRLLVTRERLLYGNEALHLFVFQSDDEFCNIFNLFYVYETFPTRKLKESCVAATL